MKTENNFNFELSVSTTVYKSKEEIHYNKINFERKKLTINNFIEEVKSGRVFSYNFNKSYFPCNYKKIVNFDYTSVIAIDVDDSEIAMNDYICTLQNKPTVAYTTYNNNVKGYRFRLIYVLEDRLTADQYKDVYFAILSSNNVVMSDNCMKSVNQCFTGNGSASVEVYNSNIIYNVCDFTEYIVKSPESVIKINKTNNSTTVSTLMSHSGRDNDYVNLSFEDYYNKYKSSYEIIESTKLEYNNGYALIDDNYIKINRRYLWTTDERGRKICVEIKNKDGENRHKRLFISALLRRRIKPEISFEELLFNTAYELERYYFNYDNKLTKKDVINVVNNVMKLSVEEMDKINIRKDKRKFELDPSLYKGRKEKAAARQAVRKHLNYEQISKYFNQQLTDKENIEILKHNGINISDRTLKRYKQEMGIKKQTNSEIIGSMFDPTLTDKENVEVMTQYGYNFTATQIRQWRWRNGINIERPESVIKINKTNNSTTVSTLMSHSGLCKEHINTQRKTTQTENDLNVLPDVCNASNEDLYCSTQKTQTERKTEPNTANSECDYTEVKELLKEIKRELNNGLSQLDIYALFRPLQNYLISDIDKEIKDFGIEQMRLIISTINNNTSNYSDNLEIIYNTTNKLTYNNVA